MPGQKPKPPAFTMPKEHGFWVMLTAAMISAAGRSQWQLLPIAITLLAGLGALGVAALIHKSIRRVEWAQLLASTTLALLIVPGELLSGMPAPQVAANVAGWAALFTASSLAVRSVFARAKRKSSLSITLTLASVVIPAAVGLLLYALSEEPPMRVALVGSAGMLLIALWRPLPKQLKKTGLGLALIVLLALAAELAL
jgi:hypothetical protein